MNPFYALDLAVAAAGLGIAYLARLTWKRYKERQGETMSGPNEWQRDLEDTLKRRDQTIEGQHEQITRLKVANERLESMLITAEMALRELTK